MVLREVRDDLQDIPTDADVDDELDDEGVHIQPSTSAISLIPLKRFDKTRQRFTRYLSDEHVLLTEGGEHESFKEAMNDEHK